MGGAIAPKPRFFYYFFSFFAEVFFFVGGGAMLDELRVAGAFLFRVSSAGGSDDDASLPSDSLELPLSELSIALSSPLSSDSTYA